MSAATPPELSESRLTKDIVLASIPAFPPIVLRVFDLLSSPEAEMGPLVEQVASDPTLTAQLLRLANSPLFGLSSQIDTVQHAISTLGFERVRSLVMAVATSNYMRGALRTDALERSWRHTLATAILAREFAKAVQLPPDRAYSLGLLHDIGRLGLLVAFPNEYASVLKAADRDPISLLDQEKKLFGLDHCETGRLLLEQWKLPAEFCVVVGRHHDPFAGGPMDSLSVCQLACQLADTLGYAVVPPLNPVPFEQILSLLPHAARERFPAEPEALLALINGVVGTEGAVAHPPVLKEPTAGSAAAELAISSPEAVPVSAARGLFGQVPSKGWDLLIVLVTGAIFTLVLAGCLWIWNPR